jgi:hypothetical protein
LSVHEASSGCGVLLVEGERIAEVGRGYAGGHKEIDRLAKELLLLIAMRESSGRLCEGFAATNGASLE